MKISSVFLLRYMAFFRNFESFLSVIRISIPTKGQLRQKVSQQSIFQNTAVFNYGLLTKPLTANTEDTPYLPCNFLPFLSKVQYFFCIREQS